MIIDFNEISEVNISNMNNGDGEIIAKMQVNEIGRFVQTIIPPGSSIGPHIQETSDDINYIIAGEGISLCDGVKEDLKSGVCHICPKGSAHSIVNTGEVDLVLFTVVPK